MLMRKYVPWQTRTVSPALSVGFLLHHQLLELEFVLVLTKFRAVRVLFFDVLVMVVCCLGCDAALLADEDLGASLLVGVVVLLPVDLRQVRLKRAALSESFPALLALVGADTCSTQYQKRKYGKKVRFLLYFKNPVGLRQLKVLHES